MAVSAQQVYGSVKAALLASDYRFTEHDNGTYLESSFQGARFVISVLFVCGDSYLTLIARLPLFVAIDLQGSVLAKLNELSVQTPCGGFELISDGPGMPSRCQAKLGLLLTQVPTREQVTQALGVAFSLAETAGGHVESILYR